MNAPSLPLNTFKIENVSPEERRLLEKHLSLILAINSDINLTRIGSFQEGLLLHVEDSLAGLPELNNAPEGLYADLGTGAGYPGIPLAIVSGRHTVLVDSTQKKMAVLDSVINELGAGKHIQTHVGRIEGLAKTKREGFSVLTARALAPLPSLVELASPLLCLFGQLVCYKAQMDETELSSAELLKEKTGMTLVSDRKFLLSDSYTTRRILVFEKYKQATLLLPRRDGMAQKRPYKP
ncbi:MAG: class I SAM-dependent methyltransferase [Eggerthellaceae bacterium]|jgi:16S rRNA (guanine527-N7)-methyltransferase|nr:class I SAM-dependent methyltransferase [Eggerthellaceae bacterium]